MYQRLSYGGTDLPPGQQQAFLKALQAVFPTAIVFSYPEAAVDPESAAAFESELQLWDVLVDVPSDLVDWLCEEVAAIVAEGFELDFLSVEALEPLEVMQLRRRLENYLVWLEEEDLTEPSTEGWSG